MATVLSTRPLCAALISTTLLAAGLVGCSKPSGLALVNEARDYYQKGDNKAAIIQLKNALQSSPDDKDARLLLGMVYIDANDAQSAEKELRKAMELGANDDKSLHLLGKVLLMQGMFDKVVNETQPASGAQFSADVATVRGNAYLGLGKAQEAKQAFELALNAHPDHPDALTGLARHALYKKDLAAAKHYSDQAVTKNPANADAWAFKGDLLRVQGHPQEALAAYEQAIKLKPRHAAALVAKAAVDIESGHVEAAQASLDTARKSGGNLVSVLYTQALLDHKQGRQAAALESLQHVLRAAPGHLQAQLLAGAVQYELGATEQAELHLKTYLNSNPNDLYARKLLAATLLKGGDAKRAFVVAAAAAKEAPQDTQLLTLAGASSMEARDFSSAADYFQKASAIAPQDPMIRTALGKSRIGQGDGSGAVAELEKAVALDKKSGQATTTLILTYVQQKQYDKALALLQTQEKEQPKSPQVQQLKGDIYQARNDLTGARHAYEAALALDPTYFQAAARLARLDLLDKKPEAAQRRFENLLATDKKNVQAMIALGQLAVSQKNTNAATRWFEQAHAENTDAVGPATQLALHYLRNGSKQKALTLAQKLQTANPASAEALDLLAQVQLANDDKNGALDSYHKLSGLKPSSATAYRRMASIYAAMQQPGAAAEALKKALAIQPDDLEAQVALAGVEQMRGNHDQAQLLAQGMQKRHPKSAAGHVLEGELWAAQRKPVPAAKAYERAYALDQNSQLAIKLHATLQQAGRDKDAEAQIGKWLSDHPSDLPVHAYLGQQYLARGDNKRAIKHYEAVLQAQPSDIRALNNLAWAYQQERDDRALGLAERAYAVEADSPAVLDTLGSILVERGEIARGVALLQKAASMLPDEMDIRYRLALGLIKSGDKEKARTELQAIVERGKEFSKAKEARALLTQL